MTAYGQFSMALDTPYFERTKPALQALLERSGIASPICTRIHESGVPLRR